MHHCMLKVVLWDFRLVPTYSLGGYCIHYSIILAQIIWSTQHPVEFLLEIHWILLNVL